MPNTHPQGRETKRSRPRYTRYEFDQLEPGEHFVIPLPRNQRDRKRIERDMRMTVMDHLNRKVRMSVGRRNQKEMAKAKPRRRRFVAQRTRAGIEVYRVS